MVCKVVLSCVVQASIGSFYFQNALCKSCTLMGQGQRQLSLAYIPMKSPTIKPMALPGLIIIKIVAEVKITLRGNFKLHIYRALNGARYSEVSGITLLLYSFFIMKPRSRLLPHLNLCYLQKRAYDAHRKKIDAIKQSIKVSLARKMSSLSESESMGPKLNPKGSANKMSTIKQEGSQAKLSIIRSMNRRKYLNQLKENQRLFKKIDTCEPTINRKNIESHKLRSEQYKNRISKFKNDPSSHKSLLKSQHSLRILQKSREREKLKQLLHFYDESRKSEIVSIAQIQQKSNSLFSRLQNFDSPKVKTEMSQYISKNSSLSRLIAGRNSQQIQNHFRKQIFSFQARKKFNVLHQYQRFGQNKRAHTQTPEKSWKSRCFTTQLQNYN